MGQYEFTSAENQRVDRLRRALSHITLLFFAVGFFLLLIGLEVPGGAKLIIMITAALFFILGVVYFRPIRGLQRITSTEGDDINNLMIAVDDLRVTFSTAQIIVALLVVMAVANIIRILF